MATYYVDGDVGNDSNAGTSEGAGNAWATLGKLCTTATSGADRGYVKASAPYALTSTLTPPTGLRIEGYMTTPGARDGRPTITSATNSLTLFSIGAIFDATFAHLELTHTASTRGKGFAATGVSEGVCIADCVIDGCSNGISGDWVVDFLMNQLRITDTEIKNCTGYGVRNSGNYTHLCGCNLHDNATAGVNGGQFNTNAVSLTLSRCRVWANGAGVTITRDARRHLRITDSVIANNTGDGVSSVSSSTSVYFRNVINYGNGGWGVNFTAAPTFVGGNRNNAYGANTSGARQNLTAGTDDVTLTADPFTDAAGGDFTVNTTAGGGAAVRSAGSPVNTDIGVFQHAAASGTIGDVTLTAVDKADGTGATATVADSEGGTVTIYGATFDGGVTDPTWTSVASRTGDGVVDVPLAEGYWWLSAFETGGGSSGPLAVNVTDGLDDPHYLAVEAIVAKCQALILTGIDSADILAKKLPLNFESRTEGVYVCPVPVSLRPIVTEQDEWSYAAQITVFRKSNRDSTENIATVMKWRKQLMDAFNLSDLPAAAFVSHTRISDKAVFDPASFAKNYDAGAFIVLPIAFENR